MELPSKELLKEVLGSRYNDRLVDWYQIEDDNFLRSYYDCGGFDEEGRPTGLGLEINIYELMHLMIMWALNKGISIDITLDADVCIISLFGDVTSTDHIVRKIHPTEFETVTEACEWILKQEVAKPLSTCCGAPFIENSEMCYPHDGIVGQCSKCMEFSEEIEYE